MFYVFLFFETCFDINEIHSFYHIMMAETPPLFYILDAFANSEYILMKIQDALISPNKYPFQLFAWILISLVQKEANWKELQVHSLGTMECKEHYLSFAGYNGGYLSFGLGDEVMYHYLSQQGTLQWIVLQKCASNEEALPPSIKEKMSTWLSDRRVQMYRLLMNQRKGT